ncbi:hypothetical protein [Magnetospirillum sp. 15-1]|uniref:hypothetical protein n=1 Tax=Magnetospirillum sp. 15-1 TaxID=1979370 RepID=UPI000BBBC7B3|nr:hypothetical protein [Magnetospirillum sp. 15-1]
MWGRFLAAFGLLFLVGACSTTVAPPHRYPMVEIPDAKTADVALYFANSFRAMIASEQIKPWEQRNRTHTLLSADNAKVVIKSENPDAFRRTGYLKLLIEPTQAGSSVVVDSRVSYIQNPDSSFEHETDIYTAAQVPSPEGFVMAYQQIFDIIAANFNAVRRRAAQMPPAG